MNKPRDIESLYREAYTRGWDDEYDSLRAMREHLSAWFKRLIYEEQKRRQPRKRVHFAPLPDHVRQPMLDEVKSSSMWAEMVRLQAHVEAGKDRQEKLLTHMAPGIELKPDLDFMQVLETSSSYTYGSQGYGAMKYAKGFLEPLLDMLVAHGFDAHIRQTNYGRGKGMFAIDHCDYELWANCPKWMFDAAHRCLSLADAVASMKRRCINPLVYNPFLPDSCRL